MRTDTMRVGFVAVLVVGATAVQAGGAADSERAEAAAEASSRSSYLRDPTMRGAPQQRPWKDRVAEARLRAAQIPTAKLPAALESGDDARLFAGLEQAYQRKVTLSERVLARALARSQTSETAYAAAFQLARHKTPTAKRALARFVARQGPGHRKVGKLLGAEAAELIAAAREDQERLNRLLDRAATARPGSRVQLEAIASLATEPGSSVDTLLGQLAGDRHEPVANAAKAALAKRRRAGL